jgi:hypothetical protein
MVEAQALGRAEMALKVDMINEKWWLNKVCNVPFQIGSLERRINGINRPVRL